MSTHGNVVSLVEDATNMVDASQGFVDAVICLVTKDGGHATLQTPSKPGILLGALWVAASVVNPTTWSSEWPTIPGWYWIRRDHDSDPECARVFLAGSGESIHTVHVISGGFAYPSEFPDVLWGPRISAPQVDQ